MLDIELFPGTFFEWPHMKGIPFPSPGIYLTLADISVETELILLIDIPT